MTVDCTAGEVSIHNRLRVHAGRLWGDTQVTRGYTAGKGWLLQWSYLIECKALVLWLVALLVGTTYTVSCRHVQHN